jgi:hypothetical protein
MSGQRLRLAAALALVIGFGVIAEGAAPGPGGKPAAPPEPTPRLPDGKVDLGGDGIWELPWVTNLSKRVIDAKTKAPTPDAIPYLPWARAMNAYSTKTKSAYDPQGFCLPPGIPRAFGTPYPAQFIQQPHRIVVIFEGGAHIWREIFMDGRPHPKDLNPTYMGHATGKWEGDTLVVDTVGFNERTYLMFDGYFHTDQLHTIERITRPNKATLHYEVTIDDPGAYERPWVAAWDIKWGAGANLEEYICQDDNQYMVDLEDEFGHPFFKPTDTEGEKH